MRTVLVVSLLLMACKNEHNAPAATTKLTYPQLEKAYRACASEPHGACYVRELGEPTETAGNRRAWYGTGGGPPSGEPLSCWELSANADDTTKLGPAPPWESSPTG